MVEKYYVTSDQQDCDTIPYDFVLATALAGKHYPTDSMLYYIRTFAYEKTGNVVKNGVQIAYRYNDTLAYQYQRKCYNGEWSDWVLLPTRAEMDAVKPKRATVTFTSGAGDITVQGMTASSSVVVSIIRSASDDVNYRVYPQPTTNKLVLYARGNDGNPPADGRQLIINYSWS